MCGIIGIVAAEATVNTQAVRVGLGLMAHRGPDGEAVWASKSGRCVLGHRRLAIIDLSPTAAQPMADASGRYVIILNGELYNYLEVRSELRNAGAAFRTESDTEVILEAYKAWGKHCLSRFNGMFAFAIYDSNTETLFCARDRYGEKPFLFSAQADVFAFASEYKALLALRGVSAELDELRLVRAAQNSACGLDGERETVFRGIHQLLPAEALTLDTRTLKVRTWRYWDVETDPQLSTLPDVEIVARFRALLKDSIRLRMRADVPVGSCLSGGLDSGSIVCLARELLGQSAEYHTFTGRFPGTPADEWDYATSLIERMRVKSHAVEPTPERLALELPEFLWFNELPVGSSSQYAQYCVFRLAKEHGVTVLLDGQGADELLGGYEQYFGRYVESLVEVGDHARLNLELSQIRSRYPLALAPRSRALRDRLPFGLRRWLAHKLDRGTSLLFGLKPDVAAKVVSENAFARDRRFNPLTSALYQESFGRYLTTLLRYGDRNSMAHSREVRLPFCDHRLADFVFSLPPCALMGDAQTKRLLRETMRGVLPEVVRTRWNKQGFLPPQAMWFGGPLLEAVREVLHSVTFSSSAVWDSHWWHYALRRLEAGETTLAWSLWHPFIAEMWKIHFLKRVEAVPKEMPVVAGA